MTTSQSSPSQSPLRHLIPHLIDKAVRKESRNREVHLPPVSTYRWWARRTEAVNGAILDAFEKDLDRRPFLADIFAGGGVIPLAAVIKRHQVYAQDLNPWAAEGLAAMLDLPAPEALSTGAQHIEARMATTLRRAYGTTLSTGEPAMLSHTLRVATAPCLTCGTLLKLFPHAMVSLKRRKERKQPEAFIACERGHL